MALAAWFGSSEPSAAPSSCDQGADCRAELLQHQARLEACWFLCSREEAAVSQARDRFRAALERRAEAEFLQQRQAAEREQQQLAAAEHEQQLRQRREAEETTHRRRLELLETQARLAREERAALREQRLSYLRQLSVDAREARLVACHEAGGDCDALVALLIDAASTAREKRRLVQLREQAVTSSAATSSDS